MAQVTLRNLVKDYDQTPAVRGIDLDIADKEFVVLVGPSGSGKTTTLRMIAGLEDITGVEILIGGDVVNDVPPKDRDIAMVFQNYALYPHMTVHENMSFGLRLKKLPKDEIRRRVAAVAGILGIGELLDRKPKQLSGGQRQRVAMGRAIVRNPKVFLFDEPLSNLDAKLRVHMRTEIKKVHQKVRTTTVYVTHDQVEAMTLADRVVVMNAGLIEQAGTPNDLYHSPATLFVAGFIGSPAMNITGCALEETAGALRVRLNGQVSFPVPAERTARDCAELFAPDLSLLLGGQKNDRNVRQRIVGPDCRDELEAVHVRHVDVRDDEVGRRAQDQVPCFHRVLGDMHGVARVPQVQLQQLANGLVVIDDQNGGWNDPIFPLIS